MNTDNVTIAPVPATVPVSATTKSATKSKPKNKPKNKSKAKAKTKVKAKAKPAVVITGRAPYGFKLPFPAKFTLSKLAETAAAKAFNIKYITLYKRVEKALEAGEITIVGEATPSETRRGRRETLYSRVDAKVVAVSVPTEQVAAIVPFVTNDEVPVGAVDVTDRPF